MSSKEVDDILDRLLAVADRLGRHQREDVEYYVDKLSRAATRERAAALDRILELNKRLAQQSLEMSRLRNMPALPAISATGAPQAQQPALAFGSDQAHKARLEAIASNTSPTSEYGSDHGRFSRPVGESELERKVGSANTAAFALSGTQRSSSGMSAPFTAIQPSTANTQEYAGYGHFNPDRMRAIQAGPDTNAALTALTKDDGPAAPAYKATVANSEPVAPRRRQPSGSSGESNSTLQSADQLLDEVDRRSAIQAGRKRKGSDSDPVAIQKRRKQLIEAVHPAGPHCTNCIAAGLLDCDVKSHCSRCMSKKCVYILCTEKRCLNHACLKIHPFEYDLSARKPGEPRRHVLHDNVNESALSESDQTVLEVATSLMKTVPRKTPSGVPLKRFALTAPRPRVQLPLDPHAPFSTAHRIMPDSKSSIEQHSNTEFKSEQLDHGYPPFQLPEAVRSMTSKTSQPAMSDPVCPSLALTDAALARNAAFSAHAGPSPFVAIMYDDKRDSFASRSSTAFGLQPTSSATGVVGSGLATGSKNPYMAGMKGSTSAARPTMFGATRASPYMFGSPGPSPWAADASASGATHPDLCGTLVWNSFMNRARRDQSQDFDSDSSTAGVVRCNPSAVDRFVVKVEKDDD